MKSRPLILTFMPIFLIGVALSFPIQIMVIYGHGIGELPAVFEKLSYLNRLVIFLCLLNATLVLRTSKLSLFITPILMVAVILNNWWVGTAATDYTLTSTLWASIVFVFLNSLLFLPGARLALLSPKQQWWRASPRKKVGLPIVISPWLEGVSFATETFDISESGAFLSNSIKSNVAIPHLKPNDFIEIRFQIAGYYQIRCSAKVVRVVVEKGSYPAGMGIQFQEMDNKDQKILRRFIKGEMSV